MLEHVRGVRPNERKLLKANHHRAISQNNIPLYPPQPTIGPKTGPGNYGVRLAPVAPAENPGDLLAVVRKLQLLASKDRAGASSMLALLAWHLKETYHPSGALPPVPPRDMLWDLLPEVLGLPYKQRRVIAHRLFEASLCCWRNRLTDLEPLFFGWAEGLHRLRSRTRTYEFIRSLIPSAGSLN